MAQKDVGNKIPIYKLKTTEEVMNYYDEWGEKNKYDKDMQDWDYTGPRETVAIFKKYALRNDIKILDAGFVFSSSILWPPFFFDFLPINKVC